MAETGPAKSTLKRYGLTVVDWQIMVVKQNAQCPVCQRRPDRFVIDHEHVKGWRKMKPAERKRYVRGLLCNRCNWQFLRRGLTTEIAYGLAHYLDRYDNATAKQST